MQHEPNERADEPHERALDEEQAQHLRARGSHRAQDADLPGFLHDRYHEHARDAERGRQRDEEPDELLERVCAEIAEKNCALVLIQLSASRSTPARIVCATVSAANGSRTLSSMLGGAAREVEQILRIAKRDVDVALVDALVAEIEDADHGHRRGGAARRRRAASLSPRLAPRSSASSVPMTMSIGPDVVSAGDDLVRERDDVEVGFGLDPGDRHGLVGVAAHREARTRDDRRDADDLRDPRDLLPHLLPLVDRAQLLRARLDLRRDRRRTRPSRNGRATCSGGRIEICAW